MKILSMTATFGTLDQDTLTFTDGLNIIDLPNEGGKSTWSAFLRVMFYGLDTRERDKKGAPADKNRYRPWSGKPMEGEILLEHQGKTLRLRRWTEGTIPMGCFSLTGAESGLPVRGFTSANVGEKLLGVSREVFTRTAFLSQPAVTVSQSPELERRILALLSSGEESVSYSATDSALAAAQKSLTGPRGKLTQLEERQTRRTALLDQLAHAEARASTATNQLRRLEPAQKYCQTIVDRWNLQNEIEQGKRYQEAKANLEAAQRSEKQATSPFTRRGVAVPSTLTLLDLQSEWKSLQSMGPAREALQAKLTQAQEEFGTLPQMDEFSPFYKLTANQAREQARVDVKHLRSLRSRLRGWTWTAVLGWLVGAGAGYALWKFHGKLFPGFDPAELLNRLGLTLTSNEGWMIAGGALTLLIGVVITILAMLGRSKAKRSYRLLAKPYPDPRPEAILASAEEYAAHWEVSDRKEGDLSVLTLQYEQAEGDYQRRYAALMEGVHAFDPLPQDLEEAGNAIATALLQTDAIRSAQQSRQTAAQLFNAVASQGKGAPQPEKEFAPVTLEQVNKAKRQLEELDNHISTYRHRQSMAMGEWNALGDPNLLRQEQAADDHTRQHLQEQSYSLSLARDLLSKANYAMEERFSPKLNSLAGAYAAALTGGRYDRVSLTRDFSAKAEASGTLDERNAELLSSGTSDQIYLAVRLALCQLVLQDENTTPLILDDALIRFDDQRLELALNTLSSLGRQILLFSCTGREKRLWKHR